ncbi:MAG: STAS domain-containing protein [Nitrospira sp. SB0677_bin_15]|nr:STAS domain-containing protein [Nitrospira sp. SB0667_bin_9]MYD32168.1 STAS domain-containing protein [Nitrospira sp. SB0661_bin_20]MYG41365.1 STAS domain-containing protein [Nitrospira sp. SB0677_bin_15]MYH02149.1 STAS domain-containing protein [Nitrospira sp. SB0675_bin_23]MYJ23288.1 STAS domain-containing protein [Nitrospira sp. SB0673_bin_12]
MRAPYLEEKLMQEKAKLSVEAEQGDKATILIVNGRVDGSSVGILENAVQEQINAGNKTLVFDFKDMSYISSAGLRALLIAARLTQKEGGKALFCALADHIAEIFEISGFNEILDIRATRTDALDAL